MNNDNEVVFELKKELSISNIMQLIDLNGSKKNFESKFILETTDPSKKVSVCVVNQDELDNGKINFEETERGKYSRRVTYQNDKHMNHYIAIKKHQDDKDEKSVDCVLIIHMKELPALPKQEEFVDESRDENEQFQTSRLNPSMTSDTKEDIRKSLFKLRDDKRYNNMPDLNEEKRDSVEYENDDIIDPNFSPNMSVPIASKKPQTSFMNSYFFLGVIFLGIFAYIFYTKKIKKH